MNLLAKQGVWIGIFLMVLPPFGSTRVVYAAIKKEAVIMRNTAEIFVEEQIRAGQKSNRLINQKSPYLLQHAFNPVDWFPWGEEAFEKARRENKPIFLSIGYSTCHWCHVMAHESFENPQIAKIINRYFVAVKVDREERPDLDQVYMAVTQAMTGSGGWPMSLFLTPDLKPFFAGTYFPPQSKYGRPGFNELLNSVQQAWQKDAGSITARGNEVIDRLAKLTAQELSSGDLKIDIFERAAGDFNRIFDRQYGGFGSSPKFPRPVALSFLLRQYKRSHDKGVLDLVTKTLDAMAAGGMYDHVGGGFHRYSVDEAWRVPHFEKMLYDQALLSIAYIEAFQLTGKRRYKEVAIDVLDFVIAELQDGQGGYYSALDADSALPEKPTRHGEGAFYLWGMDEIKTLLPPHNIELFCQTYGVRKDGNAFVDPQREFVGKNILYRAVSLEEAAQKFAKSPEEIAVILSSSLEKLKEAREVRPHPHLDDKVLTSWNGLMISAMAKGYQVFRQERFLDSARNAALFAKKTLYSDKNNVLQHRYRDGVVGIDGNLDDYAFLIQGFLDLYEASFDLSWITLAIELSELQDNYFSDQENGGFFDTSGEDKSVLLKMKTDYDGAEPAGNSVAALNLMRLGKMLSVDDLVEKGENTVKAFAKQIGKTPMGMPHMLSAYSFQTAKSSQIVIAGRRHDLSTKAMLEVVFASFIPNKIVYLADATELVQSGLDFSFLTNMTMLKDKATAYVCLDYTCKQPTDDLAILRTSLQEVFSSSK